MMRLRFAVLAALGLGITGLCSAAPVSATPWHALPSQASMHVFKTKGNARPNRSNNLAYKGGIGGIGVETSPKVYLVLWGSQWNGNDPSGEAAREQSFLQGVGGSSWLNSVTQYCQGVAVGTVFCGSSGQHAGNPSNILAGTWNDNGSAAPPDRRSSKGTSSQRRSPTSSRTAAGSTAAAPRTATSALGSARARALRPTFGSRPARSPCSRSGATPSTAAPAVASIPSEAIRPVNETGSPASRGASDLLVRRYCGDSHCPKLNEKLLPPEPMCSTPATFATTPPPGAMMSKNSVSVSSYFPFT